MPARDLPWLLLVLAIAGATAYLARFVLVPDDPVRTVRGIRDVLISSIGLALGQLAGLVERPDGRFRQRAVARALRRVDDVALALDDHLTAPLAAVLDCHTIEALQERAFEVEVALTRLETSLAAFARGEQIARAEVARILRRAPHEIRTRTRPRHVERLVRELAEATAVGRPPDRTRLRVVTSFHDLLVGLLVLRATTIHHARHPRPLPEHDHGDAPEVASGKIALSTRQAVQATVACGLAMVAGSAISSARSYWAVIAAYVMFTRASTTGETLVRGIERIVGTAAGVLIGVWLGSALVGHSHAELAVVFICLFVTYYLLRAAYTAMVLAITLLVSALYTLLGRFSPSLLYVRLAETLVGCLIGGVVALLMLPASSRDKLRDTLVEVLSSTAALLPARFASPTAARESARQMDRKLRELRVAARPLVVPLLGGHELRRVLDRARTAGLFARLLASRAGAPMNPRAQRCLRELASAVAATALAEAALVSGRSAEGVRSNSERIEHVREVLEREDLLGSGPGSPRAALDWLEAIDRALVELGAALEAGALGHPRRRHAGS